MKLVSLSALDYFVFGSIVGRERDVIAYDNFTVFSIPQSVRSYKYSWIAFGIKLGIRIAYQVGTRRTNRPKTVDRR